MFLKCSFKAIVGRDGEQYYWGNWLRMGQKKSREGNSVSQKQGDNGWTFLIAVVNGCFKLFNNNKIYPVFGLLLVGLAGLIIWRLPESELASVVHIILNEFVVNKGGLIALLLASNFGWVYLLGRQRKMYVAEIDRLAKIRSELMHVKDNGQGVHIESHRSSDDDCEELYVIPVTEKDRQAS